MMRHIFLDIETLPTSRPEVIDRIRKEAVEKRPANNVKKEIKDEWDTSAARIARGEKAVFDTGKDVLLAEPCLVVLSYGGPLTEDDIFWPKEEKYVKPLKDTLDIHADSETIWVGHNLANFDLPVLLNMFRRHGVTPPKHFPTYDGRIHGRVFDTMRRTPSTNPLGFVSLEEACSAYGYEMKEVVWNGAPLDGSRVREAYQAGAFKELVKYCQEDVRAVEYLYGVLTAKDTWGTWDRDAGIADRVREIRSNDTLTEAQKAILTVSILDAAGLVPGRA